MKKLKVFLLLLIMTMVIFTYVNCNKNDSKPNPQISASKSLASNTSSSTMNNSAFQNHIKTETTLPANDEVLVKMYNSDAWKAIPQNILSSVITKEGPKLEIYDNTKIQVILFDLKSNNSNLRYNSLVVYVLNGKFLPIIIRNERLNTGYSQISYMDMNGNYYLHFLVDKNEKFGKFTTIQDIPFEKITGPRNALSSANAPVAEVEGPTCMQKTNSFSSCMNCLIAECTADWSCAIGCAVEAPACAALMVSACAGAAAGRTS